MPKAGTAYHDVTIVLLNRALEVGMGIGWR
jgi:hypothetical protein